MGKVYRSYPKEWRDKYDTDPKYEGVASATKDVSRESCKSQLV
jgi:hypothetical protein